ncbi:MAG: glucose-6-phosphate isomerase [Clostridia bacterium]|nr:glucose-6-phosphate isomerase [Clostridia bacterium]
MSVRVNTDFLAGFIRDDEITNLRPYLTAAHKALLSGKGAGNDYLGWVTLPDDYDREEFARIKAAAEKIKRSCDIFLVLGIGGSYLGARAAIEFVKSPLYNALAKDTPEIYFAGNNLSPTALTELLSICKDKDLCLNVISKSGTTTETAVAFRIFKDLLVKKYGEDGAKDRIFATTDKCRGTLKAFADKSGYETFVVPDNVGGRFSVLTAVGLLPIAVAGIDIDALMQGAAEAKKALSSPVLKKNDALKYAAIRNILYRRGKSVEVLVGYEPYMLMLNEWWKQLFGESEGKDGKGILPDSVIFSTDLHSLGQYMQDGQRIIFETVVSVVDPGAAFEIPFDPENTDGLNYLAGKQLDDVNKTAMMATLLAHSDGGVPNTIIEVEDRSARSLGYLFYFFEFACAISGYLLGVNPFNQPGVESYKRNMFRLLGKPGYDRMEIKPIKRS